MLRDQFRQCTSLVGKAASTGYRQDKICLDRIEPKLLQYFQRRSSSQPSNLQLGLPNLPRRSIFHLCKQYIQSELEHPSKK